MQQFLGSLANVLQREYLVIEFIDLINWQPNQIDFDFHLLAQIRKVAVTILKFYFPQRAILQLFAKRVRTHLLILLLLHKLLLALHWQNLLALGSLPRRLALLCICRLIGAS